ncbi:MAG TPA: hypothetical protein VGD24_00280 [Gallionella sp.]
MYPVHDVDAILLLAMSLAAKRRPAELVEIIAAADLSLQAVPTSARMTDSLHRLGSYGLITETPDGYSLTAAAQLMLTGHAKKALPQERIRNIREHLADHNRQGDALDIHVTEKQVDAAIVAHRANKQQRSWLTPKPKPVWISKKDLAKGKTLPAKRRKD